MRSWKRIDQERPAPGAKVYFSFGDPSCEAVYPGKYQQHDAAGDSCGLSDPPADEVTYWYPRIDSDQKPLPPTQHERSLCRAKIAS